MPPAGDDICHGPPGWARTEQVEAAARGEAGPDEGGNPDVASRVKNSFDGHPGAAQFIPVGH